MTSTEVQREVSKFHNTKCHNHDVRSCQLQKFGRTKMCRITGKYHTIGQHIIEIRL